MAKKINQNCTIYLVRHGETDNNKNDILQGARIDSSLNKSGEKQAREAAKLLEQIPFCAAFSSDLIRAKQTAEIISLQHHLIVTTSQAIREREFGQFEGKPTKYFQKMLKTQLDHFATLSDEAKFNYDFAHGIETLSMTVSRLINFLREVAIAYPGKTVLIVSHGAVIRHFLIRIGFATFNQLRWDPDKAPPINNLGYAVIQSDGIDFFVTETFGINKT
ncbi:MAG: histidine phosphatase family protein [Candidatus Beckwithbacteria bacterium]